MSQSDNNFKLVSYKKKGKFSKSYNSRVGARDNFVCGSALRPDLVIRKIELAKEEIISSSFFDSFKTNFGQIPIQLKDIISYGLGQFSECASSRYQLAFLLALRDHLHANVELYDPLFSSLEVEIISHYHCKPIEFNEEGKRRVEEATLFFLPHCPKQLINNLLWKNWGKNLLNCVIVGNSFSSIVESHANRVLIESLPYVYHSSTFVTETTVQNIFKYSDIFNDLAIHTFSRNCLESVDGSVLSLNQEPFYLNEDIEFVTNNLKNTTV